MPRGQFGEAAGQRDGCRRGRQRLCQNSFKQFSAVGGRRVFGVGCIRNALTSSDIDSLHAALDPLLDSSACTTAIFAFHSGYLRHPAELTQQSFHPQDVECAAQVVGQGAEAHLGLHA